MGSDVSFSLVADQRAEWHANCASQSASTAQPGIGSAFLYQRHSAERQSGSICALLLRHA
jgi:hypothetical protein